MTKVAYDSARLIPAPYVSVSKGYQTTEDGTKIGSLYNITIIGKVMAYKGSPRMTTSAATGWASPAAATDAGFPKYQFWELSGYPDDETVSANSRLTSCLRKQEAIKMLFAQDGHTLEFQGVDGAQPMKCNPRVISVDFKDGPWYEYFDYTISLEADVIYVNGLAISEDGFNDQISESSETWQLEVDDRPENENLPRTYRLVHTVAAKGKRFFESDGTLAYDKAWKQAKSYVISRLGFDSTMFLSSGVNNVPSGYGGYNLMRLETIDETGGRYTVSESWVLTSGNALEDFNININESSDVGVRSVSIEGAITGLENRDDDNLLVTSKYTNASSHWTNVVEPALLARGQLYSGYTMNVVPISKTVGRNPTTGAITYSIQYNDRPSHLFPNSKSEVISVSYGLYTDIFAAVTVLGRTAGPVLQPLSTTGLRTVTLNVELVMPTTGYGTGSETDIRNALVYAKPSINPATSAVLTTVINAIQPSHMGASQEYISDQSENWNASEGRYVYSITYSYQ